METIGPGSRYQIDATIADVYLISMYNRNWIIGRPCFLLESEQRYLDKTLYDIEYLFAYEELQRQKSQGKRLQEKVDLIANIESIVSKAKEDTEAVLDDNTSNRQRVAGIRDNRALEKDKRRKNEGFELAKEEISNSTEATNNKVNTQSEDSESSKLLQPDHMDLLRRKRQERKRGED